MLRAVVCALAALGAARAQEEADSAQADLSGLIAAAASDAAAVAALEAFTSGGGSIERDEGEHVARARLRGAACARAWRAACACAARLTPAYHAPPPLPPLPTSCGAAKEAVEFAMGHGWWDTSAKLIEVSAAAGVDVSTTVHQTSSSIQKKLQHLKDQLSRGASMCVCTP